MKDFETRKKIREEENGTVFQDNRDYKYFAVMIMESNHIVDEAHASWFQCLIMWDRIGVQRR